MHGKTKFKTPPLFRREKDMLKIAASPSKLQALKEISEHFSHVKDVFKHCKTLIEWYSYVETILPDDMKNKTEFIKKLEALVHEYRNE